MHGSVLRGVGQALQGISRLVTLSIGAMTATLALVLAIFLPLLVQLLVEAIAHGFSSWLSALGLVLVLAALPQLVLEVLKTAIPVTLGVLPAAALMLPMRGAHAFLWLALLGAGSGVLVVGLNHTQPLDLIIAGVVPGMISGVVFAYFARSDDLATSPA